MTPTALFCLSLVPSAVLLGLRTALIRAAVVPLWVRAWLFNLALIGLVVGPSFAVGVSFEEGSRSLAVLFCGSFTMLGLGIARAVRERRIVNHVREFHESMRRSEGNDLPEKADFHRRMMYTKRLEIRGGVRELAEIGLGRWLPEEYREAAH